METYSPKQIADALKVSTTTLRRYEEQELIPAVPRTKGSHRMYTSIHLQAFTAIRAMLKGYDIPVVYDVMRRCKQARFEEALWFVNEQQYHIQVERRRVEEILTMIQNTDFTRYQNVKLTEYMSIGEAAKIAGVNPSAIRHWEYEGLVHSERNEENGYRMFSVAELRKILVISSLRKTVYYIENMKELLNDLDVQSYDKIERSFQLALENLNRQLLDQMKGIAELIKYIGLYQEVNI
ncbi:MULTISPECIES: MerR family transcriptional regulator [unclassified Paenibacillus]|uniref:MerR family transcriptional regulator n=1 Tax=unclassified Paenibacillus TaxID=185978 RepID=UPI000837E4D5|nr:MULTISPECIES: MerR family transcriptional regulator [unclassified Paenibacillus]NWL89426.1 MerR family DNA-binding transcriptional regulator [Paenibacillus sp. 79R4]